MSLSNLRILIGGEDKERRLRFENEIEDTEFVDLFWDGSINFGTKMLYSDASTLDRSGSISTKNQLYHLKSTRML